jgi:AraC-like DNA-binding protein
MAKAVNEINAYVKHTLQVLRDQQVDVDPLMKRFNIAEASLDDDEDHISRAQYSRLLDEVIRKYPLPGLGLLDGRGVNLLDHGLLGYAMFASANLGRAIERHTRYQDVIGAVLTTRLFIDGDTAHLRVVEIVRPDMVDSENKMHYELERLFCQWAEIGSAIGRDRHWFESVEFSYGAPSYRHMYRQMLGDQVLFDRPFNQMNFSAQLLQQSLSFANEAAAQLCERQCAALLEELQDSGGLVAEIRRLLGRNPGHYPPIEQAAAHLALGERTLRRRLSDEGTTYKQVVLDFRMELAASYLRNGSMTVQEAAYVTGYSDPSNFHRTFSKYHGETPSQYRQRQAQDFLSA